MNGLLVLPQDMLCSAETLGNHFTTAIAQIPVDVYFPSFNDKRSPNIGTNNPLLPPSIGKAWKRSGKPLNWGYPVSYPKPDASVSLLAFSISCSQTEEREVAKKYIRISIGGQIHLFIIVFWKPSKGSGKIELYPTARRTCSYRGVRDVYQNRQS